MPKSVMQTLCAQTDSIPADWECLDGPETGVGSEQWYVHRDGREAYTCNDQGHIAIEVIKPDREQPAFGSSE